jgi:multiple sugar transport system permease protein
MAQIKGTLVTARQGRRQGARQLVSFDGPWPWLLPTILLLLLYSIYPLLFNLYRSFFEFDPVSKVFEPVGLENWATLFSDERVYNALRVTLTYTALALSIEFVLGMLIALLFDREPWGVGILQTLFILPMVVPPAIAAMIFRLLEHSDFGAISWLLYNLGILTPAEPLLGGTGKHALSSVLLVDIWQWTPFFALILLAGLKSLPHEPLEAAQVDGASVWQRFWHVKLPLLRGVIAVAVLFRLIDLYKMFDYVFILTSGGPGNRTETLSYYGYLQSFSFIKWGYGAALGVFITLLIWASAFAYTKIFKVRW